MRKRMVLLGLTVLALMVLSMTLSMARTFPINPIFLAPGLREQGAYTMIVPGTYGHLIPILPFPWAKDQNPVPSPTGNDEGTAVGPQSNNTSNLRPGSGSLGTAPPSGKIGGSGYGSPVSENMGMPMGNVLSGGSVASSRVDHLENDLRDAIRRLNAK
jgi:hypothetical protein